MKSLAGAKPIVEDTDVRSKALLVESRKNQLVKKWAPVLSKCKEIKPAKFGLLAAVMENQMNWSDPQNRSVILEDATTTGDIADFTRFALPLIRKSYPK